MESPLIINKIAKFAIEYAQQNHMYFNVDYANS